MTRLLIPLLVAAHVAVFFAAVYWTRDPWMVVLAEFTFAGLVCVAAAVGGLLARHAERGEI